MLNFKSYDAAEMLGLTPLLRTALPDAMLYDELLTPTVKAMLGPLVSAGEPAVFETQKGRFPGDEASNLNAHLIFGEEGFVRYPYISVCHRTAYGAFLIKRDLRKLQVLAYVGEIDSGKAELIFMLGLRDRRFDGTRAANDTALLSFPYDSPLNNPLSAQLRGLELSIYSFLPGSRIKDACGDVELDRFVEKPFSFILQPDLFLALFEKAWKSKRAPGQHAAPVKDTAKLILPAAEKVARLCGYDFLEAACSHYHVAMWFLASGYKICQQKDAEVLSSISSGLKRIRDEGTPLTRSQQSWLCVLQNLGFEKVPARFRLGVNWPQDNISQNSLWLAKALSPRAQELELPVKS